MDFFISPSRSATSDILDWCGQYVEKLEKEGIKIHWPIRDTDQNDPIGINICDTNLGKILKAHRVYVYYLPDSTGIHFDLGAVYMLIFLGYKKEVIFVNGDKKEFEDKYVSKETLRSILEAGKISIKYTKKDIALHFFLGAVYILIRILGYQKRIVFINKNEFPEFVPEEQIVKGGKSFLNVLNYLEKTTGGKNERIQSD